MLKWSRIFQSKWQGLQYRQSPYISTAIPWSGRTFSCGGSIKFPLGWCLRFSTFLGSGIRCVPSSLTVHLVNRIKQGLAKASHLYQSSTLSELQEWLSIISEVVYWNEDFTTKQSIFKFDNLERVCVGFLSLFQHLTSPWQNVIGNCINLLVFYPPGPPQKNVCLSSTSRSITKRLVYQFVSHNANFPLSWTFI